MKLHQEAAACVDRSHGESILRGLRPTLVRLLRLLMAVGVFGLHHVHVDTGQDVSHAHAAGYPVLASDGQQALRIPHCRDVARLHDAADERLAQLPLQLLKLIFECPHSEHQVRIARTVAARASSVGPCLDKAQMNTMGQMAWSVKRLNQHATWIASFWGWLRCFAMS